MIEVKMISDGVPSITVNYYVDARDALLKAIPA
jgi:hypothetical protein